MMCKEEKSKLSIKVMLAGEWQCQKPSLASLRTIVSLSSPRPAWGSWRPASLPNEVLEGF